MTKFFSFHIVMLLSGISLAQCGLNGQFMLNGNDYTRGIEIGPDGNIYTIMHESSANNPARVEKRDPAGNILATYILNNGITNDPIVLYDIEVNENNDVFICGAWHGAIDLGGGYSVSQSPYGARGFAAKLGPNLNILWGIFSEGTDTGEIFSSISVDSLGSCYLAGEFKTNFIIGGIDLSTSTPSYKSFLARLDENTGDVIWAIPQNYPHQRTPTVEVDNNGEVYELSWSWNTHAITIEKYDSLGTMQWNLLGTGGENYLDATRINKDGDLIMSGVLGDTLAFGNQVLANEYYKGIYLSKIKKNGTVSFIERIGATDYLADIEMSHKSLHLANDGTYYISGISTHDLNFNGLISNNGSLNEDYFVAKFDSLNTPIWTRSFGVCSSYSYESGVRLIDDCNVFFYGTFDDSVYIDTALYTPSSFNSKRKILVELDQNNGDVVFVSDTFSNPFGQNGVGLNQEEYLKLKIYPNPFTNTIYLDYTESVPNQIVFNLYNPSGNLVYTEKVAPSTNSKVNLDFLSSGFFFYEFTDINGRLIERGKLCKSK